MRYLVPLFAALVALAGPLTAHAADHSACRQSLQSLTNASSSASFEAGRAEGDCRDADTSCAADRACRLVPGDDVKYQGCPPFPETRQYVASILKAYGGEPIRGDLKPHRLNPGDGPRGTRPRETPGISLEGLWPQMENCGPTMPAWLSPLESDPAAFLRHWERASFGGQAFCRPPKGSIELVKRMRNQAYNFFLNKRFEDIMEKKQFSRRNIIVCVLALLVAVSFCACSSMEEKRDKFQASGQALFQKGDYVRATPRMWRNGQKSPALAKNIPYHAGRGRWKGG